MDFSVRYIFNHSRLTSTACLFDVGFKAHFYLFTHGLLATYFMVNVHCSDTELLV